ncbi:MAG: hypothetical protein V8R75_15560 [Oscillospiraceae bacterium]|jgi:hypothetical protein|nr:MAG TPA: replisome organizer [Caudoviricetes sp.]
MPNRIIKESICTSDSISALTDFQETFFYRLIVNCDDFGRMDARPAILKARLYPLRERLTLKEIESALRALATVGCVEVYEVDGKPYLRLPSWEVHQQIRAKKSKFPGPECANGSNDTTCNQMISDDFKCPRNPIQSESNPNPNRESESEDSAEPETVSTPPAAELPLNDGTFFPVSVEQCQEWAGLYPAVDVIQQLREMRGWLDANPDRRKTSRGIKAFIVRWLAKEQDKGGAIRQKPASTPTNKSAWGYVK